MDDLAGRHLYLCTPLRDDLLAFIASAVRGGVDVVQLRDKTADAATILAAARECARLCGDLGVPFIVNDRPDIALDAGADGVHVGQDDVPVTVCRKILGSGAIVGKSTHERRDLVAALDEPTSYLSAGPVSATPTKPGRAATGTDYPASAQRATTQPVFVTGGVSVATVGPLAAAGLRHFVVVRAITEARDPRAAAAAISAAIAAALAAAGPISAR